MVGSYCCGYWGAERYTRIKPCPPPPYVHHFKPYVFREYLVLGFVAHGSTQRARHKRNFAVVGYSMATTSYNMLIQQTSINSLLFCLGSKRPSTTNEKRAKNAANPNIKQTVAYQDQRNIQPLRKPEQTKHQTVTFQNDYTNILVRTSSKRRSWHKVTIKRATKK